MMRAIALSSIVLALGMGPALAGAPYVAPKLTAGQVVTPPADLIETAKGLLEAARGGNTEKMAPFFAVSVTVVSAGLELDKPRQRSKVNGKAGTDAIIAGLGSHTGGDWDVPQGADLNLFLAKMERDFIVSALTDGRPWGTDPMVKGATCTYTAPSYAAKEIKAAAKALGVESSGFVSVRAAQPVLAAADAKAAEAGTLTPGLLYAVDYDAKAPKGWSAFHLAAGGTGFARIVGDNLEQPYVQGLCFAKGKDGWRVVAQVSTGL